MRDLNKFLLLFTFVFFTAFTFAQISVNGIVTTDDGTVLPGVTVMVKGTTVGTITDSNGKYKIEAPAGTQFLVFSYVGMATQEVALKAGTIDVTLKPENAELVEIFVVADRAKERETPVAFSDVTKKEIEQQLGSRDIPLIMNQTPGVYATAGGGGAGDARINVRGFNQRNVAIMLNGVPVNDMENGWVYWSNWDGIADATSSIQMQRGLSAVNLATPSVGGTMNIITSPADKKAGGSAKLEYGSGNFMKMSLNGNTGLINDKFALSVSLVGKQGSGVIDQTWTKAWAYYMGATYKVNKNHKLELFVLGAPQRHGQNLYKQNVAAYSHDYAKELGADDSTLLAYPEADANILYPGFTGKAKGGRYYNENWSPISVDYNGKQWWNGKEHDRFSKDFINERENFYHKPLTNLNWYATWSPKVKQYTTLYYSGGKGGGSGTYGSMRWNYNAGIYDSPSRFVSWDETYSNNTATDTAYGILRNSVNQQWTVGAISRVQFLLSDKFKAQIGVDWRTANIDHFREVRDLVGGKFFFYDGNEFDSPSNYNKVLGDKIDYNFTNTVDWIGYFAQAEYNTDKFTAYGTFGNSYISYTYTNHFRKGTDGKELFAETKKLPGYQIKGGVSYRPIAGFSIFGNYGYISKAPIFDNIISDRDGTVADEVQKEIFNAYEFGVNDQNPKK
ncbi:MAG: TonB-dependent receptor, partial [Bacteroidales bacterium]|nr:TonB-dependent receptor [Bacteroidales bacterium]